MLCDGGGGEHVECAGQWALGSHCGGGEHIAQRSSRPAASHGGGGEQILPRWRWRAVGSWHLHQSSGESTVAVESRLLAGILERQDFTVAVESSLHRATHAYRGITKTENHDFHMFSPRAENDSCSLGFY